MEHIVRNGGAGTILFNFHLYAPPMSSAKFRHPECSEEERDERNEGAPIISISYFQNDPSSNRIYTVFLRMTCFARDKKAGIIFRSVSIPYLTRLVLILEAQHQICLYSYFGASLVYNNETSSS